MTKLENVCAAQYSGIAQKDLEANNGNYPIYGASGLIKYVDFYKQEKPYIAVVKDGAGVGRVMMLPAKSSVIGTMQYIIPNDNANICYLAYALEYMNLAKYYTGATIPHIYFKDYKKETFKLPALPEQKQKAAALSGICDLISMHQEQIIKLDEFVKSRFIELFGDFRTNPRGWEVRNFEEVSELITDGEHATPRRTEKGIYLLSARNVLNHSLQLDDVDYIDEEEYLRIAKRVIPSAGDVLISCSGSIGRCCVVPKNLKFQMVRSAALIRFDPKIINPIFAEWLITSDDLQQQIAQSVTQSSQANLFQGKIRKLHGFVPPMELQNEFAAFVEHSDKLKFDRQICLQKMEILKVIPLEYLFA